ncbi:MAG: hypothetical protein IKQ20_05535 [Bacteroidales bacterium]|nr:hypothetical protein [Bacteroidales bacterium]
MKDIFFIRDEFLFFEKGILRGDDVVFLSSFRKKTCRWGEKRVDAQEWGGGIAEGIF